MISRVVKYAAAAAALVAGLSATPAALAAGVGGVEVTPREGTAFHVTAPADGSASEQFTVRNIGRVTATVRLYTAAATRTEGGGWSVAAAGSAPWLELPTESVTLTAGQSRQLQLTVRGSDDDRTGAVVVEQGSGTVVQRAATLVYAKPGLRIPMPLLVVIAAGMLVAILGFAFVLTTRSRRAHEAGLTGQERLLDDASRPELAISAT